MRGSTSSKVFWLALMLVALASCKSRRERGVVLLEGERFVSKSEATAVRRGIQAAQLEYLSFSGRAKSTIKLNKDVHDVTTHIRIRKDEMIWVSVTAVLGMEVARVLITPDRIRIINRLQSVYLDQPFGYVHRFASEQLDFGALQGLLLGEVLQGFVDDGTPITAFDEGFVLRGVRGDLQHAQTTDYDHQAYYTVLEDSVARQRLVAMYENRAEFSGRLFPQVLQLAMNAQGLDLQIDMTYNRITFDAPVDVPFTVPPRFSEVR